MGANFCRAGHEIIRAQAFHFDIAARARGSDICFTNAKRVTTQVRGGHAEMGFSSRWTLNSLGIFHGAAQGIALGSPIQRRLILISPRDVSQPHCFLLRNYRYHVRHIAGAETSTDCQLNPLEQTATSPLLF